MNKKDFNKKPFEELAPRRTSRLMWSEPEKKKKRNREGREKAAIKIGWASPVGSCRETKTLTL